MLSISLGPVALPVPPLLLLAVVWAASWVVTRLHARSQAATPPVEQPQVASNAIIFAAGIGLLGARVAHLAMNSDLYLDEPVSAIDLRDGGWHTATGIAVGAAWLAWKGWRVPTLRRPLLIAALAGLGAWTIASMALSPRNTAPMPTLVFSPLDGGPPRELRQAAAGRPVVVNLWASWCGPCRQEMPTLAEAQQRDGTVGFLFVNQGESEATVRTYLASLGAPLREVLLDPGARLGPAVGSRGLPTTLFYDAQGQLVDAHFGVLNAAALESRLRTLRSSR
ncbi:MAG: redoxin [Burkholderiales bacterium 28-67-8]|nr:MAG: redoxin [Burkholderiales bacterium 28-67-8]